MMSKCKSFAGGWNEQVEQAAGFCAGLSLPGVSIARMSGGGRGEVR